MMDPMGQQNRSGSDNDYCRNISNMSQPFNRFISVLSSVKRLCAVPTGTGAGIWRQHAGH